MSLISPTRNGAFLAQEGPGTISRAVVRLKAGSVYVSGSVVSAESVGGNPTGVYVLAPDTATTAAVVLYTTDATEGAAEATVIARTAEVKSGELTLAAGTTLAEATAILAATDIIVRASV